MKNILKSIFLISVLTLVSCNEELDDLTGQYALDTYKLTTVSDQTTTKLGKGVKLIEITFTDGTNTLQMAFGSTEWILPVKAYTYAPSTDGTYSSAVGSGNYALQAYVGGSEIAVADDHEMTITMDSDSIYTITFITEVEGANNVKMTYTGAIDFEIGEDDPEASGYVISIEESSVYDSSYNVYSDYTKYVMTITDPDGNTCAEFDAVNYAGLSMPSLVGDYTLASYPIEAWLMDGGWVVYYPTWGIEMAGGTYYTDDDGVAQYIYEGVVSITATEDADGNALYSFSGSDLTQQTAQAEESTGGSFSINYATLETSVESDLTILSDLTFTSTAMGMDIAYTVILPSSYDGTTKYPVLYLLHGASGSNNDWITGADIDDELASAVAAGTAPEMIIIMPNCTINGTDYFYCDGYVDGGNYKTFFFDEFMPYVEAAYNVNATGSMRAVAGLSMGGYGALYWGGLYPSDFCYIYACSPVAYMDGCPNLYDIYGTDYAMGYTMPGITMEIGTSDYLYDYAAYFNYALTSWYGMTTTWIERDGTHDWTFWAECAPKIITAVGAAFEE